jgi:homoserine/homoserine lactone efflux protein
VKLWKTLVPCRKIRNTLSATTLLLYIAACFSVTVLPGPTMLLALSNGTTGRAPIVAAGIAGAALSDLLLIGAVALGLGAALAASEVLFQCVKWLGVAYLCWLSFTLWRSHPQALRVVAFEGDAQARTALLRAFRRSLLVALSNPKGLLFFSAFLPQFIDTTQPQAPQYLLLALVTAVLDLAVMACYAAGGVQMARYLSVAALRRLNRLCASVLSSFACLLALYGRSQA